MMPEKIRLSSSWPPSAVLTLRVRVKVRVSAAAALELLYSYTAALQSIPPSKLL